MKFNDVIIEADLSTILSALREDLLQRDVDVFSVTKRNGDNVQTICPFHKGGKERKPSFGIHTETGACNCFACGWKGYLPYLIANLYGRVDEEFGIKWLQTNFSSTTLEHRQKLYIAERNTIISKPQYVTEEELSKYRYYHPYMYKRGLTNPIIEMFDIGYDKETDSITFPVKDIDGNTVFVARRSVRYKRFNYPSGVDKPVYGAYLFKTGKYKQCYITESFFNCLTLWKLGYPSVSLMGTGSKSQIEVLKQLPVREYILALDPDTAGRNGTIKLRNALQNYKSLKEVQYLDSSKDINDLQDEFISLKNIF